MSLLGGVGGSVVGSATVRLLLDSTQLNAGLSRAQAQTAAATNKMGASTQKFSGLSTTAYLAIGTAIAGFVAKGVKEFVALDKAQRQTEAVLKSTGGAANVTAEEVRNLAASLEEMSSVDEIAIQQGENLLLTFKNIQNQVGAGNDIFDQATKAALDLSVAMGMDMTSAAILVGKALNDPAQGLSKLTRQGVTFTEQQKEQIKTLVATGQALEAQKIILQEINSEFGGSAKALGESLEGRVKRIGDIFSDLARDTVGALVPAFESVMEVVGPVAEGFAFVVKTVAESEVAFGLLLFAINPVLGALNLVKEAFQGFKEQGEINSLLEQIQELGEQGPEAAGRLANKIGELAAITGDEELAAKAAAFAEKEHAGALDEASDAATRAGDAWASAGPALDFLAQAIGKTTSQLRDEAMEALREGEKATQEFISSVSEGVDEFRASLEENLNGVASALQELASEENLSAEKIIASFEKQLQVMNRFGSDLETIAKRGGKAAQSLIQELGEMGLEGAQIAEKLAGANDKQFGKIIALWEQGGAKAKGLAGQIAGPLVDAIDRLTEVLIAAAKQAGFDIEIDTSDVDRARSKLNSFFADMNGRTIVQYIEMREKGFGGAAEGVTNFKGGLIRVGEKGPELLSLPKGSDVIPNHRMHTVLSGLDSQKGSSGTAVIGGNSTEIHIHGDIYAQDADQFARKVVDALDREVARR